jgi:hypothetical protein
VPEGGIVIRVITSSAIRISAENVRRLALATGRKVWLYEGTDGADLHATAVEEPQRRLIGVYTESAPTIWIESDLVAHLVGQRQGA